MPLVGTDAVLTTPNPRLKLWKSPPSGKISTDYSDTGMCKKMDDNPLSFDPFEPVEAKTALPFAGREEAFALLYHHLNDPTNTEGVTFLGRRRIGKTTVLQQFAEKAATSFLAVYLPLRELSFRNEGEWLHILSRSIVNTVSSQGYTIAEMDTPPDEPHALREWLPTQCIPAALRAIRHRKRMALMLDDLEAFLDSSGALVVPPDSFAYLRAFRHLQMGIAMTIDLAVESKLQEFSPLVRTGSVHRLTRLTPEVTAMLLHDPNSSLNTLTDDAIAIIHRETGGEAVLAQHFVACLRNTDKETITADDAKNAIPAAYSSGNADLNLLWSLLNLEEQRVLGAISSLKYRNPLRPVDTNAIENWLVRTDYMTDTTSISRALRSMEYYDIVAGSASDISISAGLMHKWLLENAEIDSDKAVIMPGSRRRILIGLAMGVIFLLVLLVILSGGTKQQVTTTPVPTAPLSTTE